MPTNIMQILHTDLEGSPILIAWRDRAACWGQDPELFFPDGNTGQPLLQTEKAKAVCRRCEVAEACLNWAIESGQDTGVWGGLSEDERRAPQTAQCPLPPRQLSR
jgi:WhiB family redox-sensing transcriptional regulator